MGLDQTAYAVSKKGSEKTSEELAYWRKHNALQGWMENLYHLRGGKEPFNCEEIELTSEDIDLLESVVENNALPETQGFFYGPDSSQDEHKKEITVEFIKAARFHLGLGSEIYYSCSW
jgi:hypothetical protein